jgi:hypothetical protein
MPQEQFLQHQQLTNQNLPPQDPHQLLTSQSLLLGRLESTPPAKTEDRLQQHQLINQLEESKSGEIFDKVSN